jgi:hypothetical protein
MLKVTRRGFLRGGAKAMGAAAVFPAGQGQLSSFSLGSTGQQSQPDLQAALARTGSPVPVKIDIACAEPVRVMRGGIGASFHAISATLPGRKPNGDTWSGSESGGNPDAGDDQRWKELLKYADWLGMDWCRVELEQRMYEPDRRVFDWDNPEMRALDRILDWAEHRGVDVFLQQMESDVAWNAYPGNAEDSLRRYRSAPYSLPEWAYGLGELLDHLTRKKAYTCIRWVSLFNEPGHDGFSSSQDSNMKSVPIAPAFKALREELDRRGIAVPISGPDWTDLPDLKPADLDFEAYIGAYDLHSYDAVFDSVMQMGGYTLTKAEERMSRWAKWAHARNKPFFMSEFGTMAYGWGHRDSGPACYQSGLKNASLVVRGINAGVDGFSRWSFTNRGDLDGQWQLVRTWDIDQNRLLDSFSPQPNAYYQYAMLTRYLPKYCGVLTTRVEAPFLPEDRKVVAAALRTPKNNLTVLLVNECDRVVDVNIELEALPAPVRFERYALTKEMEDRSSVDLRSDRSIEVSSALSDRIPPMSIVVYSTFLLNAHDPGLVNE